MRQNNNTGATFNCECDLSGGCKVVIDPTDASSISCLNSGCSGECGWVVKLAGIRGLAFVARAE